jgi:hypothetical protein
LLAGAASIAEAKRGEPSIVDDRQGLAVDNPKDSAEPAICEARLPAMSRKLPFVSTFSAVRNHFVPPRSHRSALSTRLHRLRAMAEWKSVTAAA